MIICFSEFANRKVLTEGQRKSQLLNQKSSELDKTILDKIQRIDMKRETQKLFSICGMRSS